MSQVKLFIFDMGGVVVHNPSVTAAIAAHLGIDEAEFYRGAASDSSVTHTSPYHLGDLAAFMRGEIDSAGFWRNFADRSGITVSSNLWYDFFKPALYPETIAIIERLKNSGRRVVCGTNTLDAHYQKHIERGDYSVFDAVYASHLMGIIKPDPAFWRYILDAEKVEPSEAFFIDDLAENIRAAEKMGLRARLFTGAEGLAEALTGL